MKTIWIILITIIVTGVIAGGVAYYAGRNQWDKEKIELDKKVETLQNEIRSLNQQVLELENNSNEQKTKLSEEPATFKKDATTGYSGTLTLTGYLVRKERNAAMEGEPAEIVDYASFVFTKSNSNIFDAFLKENEGNSFVANNSVGLGCYDKDGAKIYSNNDSDAGETQNSITGNELKVLLASSSTNQVKLQLTKPVYTSGRGAPACYSHFRDFKVIE